MNADIPFELEKVRATLNKIQTDLEEKNDVNSFYLLNRYAYPLTWILKASRLSFNREDFAMYLEFLEKYRQSQA
jgi:hypothetical protein